MGDQGGMWSGTGAVTGRGKEGGAEGGMDGLSWGAGACIGGMQSSEAPPTDRGAA